MAEAALYRSRGPFFIFTLLCLVGLATSHTDMEEQLEKIMEELHKSESLKADHKLLHTMSDLINGHMDSTTAFMGRVSQNLPDDFPPMDGLLQNLKGFKENIKTYTDELKKVLGEKIKKTDQKLREPWKLHEMFEEQHEEL